MISYDIIIRVAEIIQSAAYSNPDDFQHVNFIFSSKNLFHYFRGLFNDKTDPRAM
jgi:hypothetical protein